MDNQNHNKELNIYELLNMLYQKKFLIIVLTTSFTILSVLVSLILPNMYTSSALLAPSEQNNSLSSKVGGISAIAGMAGVSLGGESIIPSVEAIERIKSFDFFRESILPNIKKENLLAVKSWDPSRNLINYHKSDFDITTNKWVRKVKYPKQTEPSNQELFEEFQKIITIVENKKTQFVTISINHQSPHIAQKWLNIIIYNINESMRDDEKMLATNSIEFLNETIKNTNLIEIKESISGLLENQIQKLMLASANEFFVFKVIDSPLVREKKSSPNRIFIVILGALFGFMIGILISFFSYLSKVKD